MAEKLINTIIFDVGGVLVNFRENEYFSSKGYSEEMAERLKEATFRNPAWKEFDRGVLTKEEIMARFERTEPELAEDIKKSFATFEDVVTRRDTAVPWIDSLKARGYKVYILSNFSTYGLHDCEKAMDFKYHVDGCFWSSDYQLIKPDRAIYLAMLDKFSIDPKRAVFIDDTRRNLDAAAELGIRTVLYKDQSQAEADLEVILSIDMPVSDPRTNTKALSPGTWYGSETIGSIEEILLNTREQCQMMEQMIKKQIEVKDAMIDKLHAELDKYRKGTTDREVDQIIKNVIKYSKEMEAELKSPGWADMTADNLRSEYEYVYGDLLDLLDFQNVDAYSTGPGEAFDASIHQAKRRIRTDDPVLDRKVSESLAPGYTRDGRVLVYEQVAVYRYEKPL